MSLGDTRGKAASVLVIAGVILSVLIVAPPPAMAASTTWMPRRQSKDSGPAVHHDTSPPLASIPPAPPPPDDKKKEHHDKRDDYHFQQVSPSGPDPVVQSQPGSGAAPPTANSFDGLGVGFTGPQGTFQFVGVPSDDNIAVGPSCASLAWRLKTERRRITHHSSLILNLVEADKRFSHAPRP